MKQLEKEVVNIQKIILKNFKDVGKGGWAAAKRHYVLAGKSDSKPVRA